MAQKPKTVDLDTAAGPDEMAAADLDAAAAATEGTTAVATRSLALGEVAGDPSDLIKPTLKLTYGVGKLALTFTPGDLVLNEKHRITGKDEPVQCVILTCSKEFKENLPWDPNRTEPPRTFPDREAAHAAGLGTEWTDDPVTGRRKPPGAQESSKIELLIEKPDDLECPLFCITLDGKEYAPAQWFVDKSAWARTAKKILSARQMELAERGILAGRWDLVTKIEMVNGNAVPMPYLDLVGINSDEFMDALRARFS
jgi:hypothetical protein